MDWERIIGGSIELIVRTSVLAVIAYVSLVGILRVSGKRAVSKWNAFDLIVTVALGSTLASTILSSEVSLAQGVLALLLLVLFQFTLTWLGVRSDHIEHLIKSTPTLLVRDGELLRDAMRSERVPEEELFAAIRRRGVGDVGDVRAAVLETDGSISVLTSVADGDRSSLRNVPGWDHRR